MILLTYSKYEGKHNKKERIEIWMALPFCDVRQNVRKTMLSRFEMAGSAR